LFQLDTYSSWFIVSAVTAFALEGIFIKYFYDKKYKYAFILNVVGLGIMIAHTYVIYGQLIGKDYQNFWYVTVILVMVINLLFGLCFVYSRAKERHYLKISGVVLFILAIFYSTLLVSSWTSGSPELKASMNRIFPWLELSTIIFAVLYILNFLSELKELQENGDTQVASKGLNAVLIIFGLLSLFGVQYFILQIAIESGGIW